MSLPERETKTPIAVVLEQRCRTKKMLPKRFSAHDFPALGLKIRDIYQDIHAVAAFPVETSTLKDISRWCGFKARHPEMDGWVAALAYGSGAPKKRLKQKLLEYNEDDILSLKYVVVYIESRSERALPPLTADDVCSISIAYHEPNLFNAKLS